MGGQPTRPRANARRREIASPLGLVSVVGRCTIQERSHFLSIHLPSVCMLLLCAHPVVPLDISAHLPNASGGPLHASETSGFRLLDPRSNEPPPLADIICGSQARSLTFKYCLDILSGRHWGLRSVHGHSFHYLGPAMRPAPSAADGPASDLSD